MIFGTFSEQSLPLDPAAIVRVDLPAPSSTRQWLTHVHEKLKHLLPESDRPALLTEHLFDAARRPTDVFGHFGLSEDRLSSLRTNWNGLTHTAQAAGAGREGDGEPELWPGFDDAWVPGYDDLPLAGRLGWATVGSSKKEADAIVLLPGLLGDNRVRRTRDLAVGLKACGFHVFALELRGHGMTDRRTPHAAYSFSSLETADLLAVSRWLSAQPGVRRTGLVGFCWGANHALNVAWYDGSRGTNSGITPAIAEKLGPFIDVRHFDAGILAFSPVLRFEELLDKLDVKRSKIREPVMAGLQSTVRERMKRKGYPDPDGSLRRLISMEISQTVLAGPDAERDAYQFVRMLPYREIIHDPKLQITRTPTVIVHAANDPMAPAQDIADLFARIDNPLVAGIVLPGGGHVGFAPYAKDYYYSFIVNFFANGPAPRTEHRS